MYLAVSLETVLSKLIQHARRVLEQHEDPFAITKEAIERAIYQDTSLTELSNAMSRYQNQGNFSIFVKATVSLIATIDDTAEFEIVEDEPENEEKEPEPEIQTELEEQTSELSEVEDRSELSEEDLVQVPKVDPNPVDLAPASDDEPESTIKEGSISEEEEIPAIPEVSEPEVLINQTRQLDEPLVEKETETEIETETEQVEDEEPAFVNEIPSDSPSELESVDLESVSLIQVHILVSCAELG